MNHTEIVTLIGNLITRLNRIEAAVVHNKPSGEPLGTVLDQTIASLSRATMELASRLPVRHD